MSEPCIDRMTTSPPPLARSEDRRAIALLVVSPDGGLRGRLRDRLQAPRWLLLEAVSGADALEKLAHAPVDVLLLDPALPDILANEFAAMVLDRFPALELLTVDAQTGHLLLGGAAPTALASQLTELIYRDDAARNSAPPGFSRGAIVPRDTGDAKPGLRGMVGDSEPMQRVYRMTQMVARAETTVLITGESGTGKDLIAQAIHMISPRAKHPFAVVNCAAIPEALLEAELFGYAKGAFTGAMQSRIGRIHAAHGGTLFLDEIGDMPLSLQSKILRFLEQGEVQRLGGNDNLKVDVRVVAATNANLKALVEQKLFREDLYYRLAVFPIQLPPLRERGGDIGALVPAFAARFCPGAHVHHEVIRQLNRHSWPGNVRELRNLIERASILMGGAREMTMDHILF
jgi:DNA-binding NtrC family response regulator